MAYKYLDETGLAYFWGKLKGYFQEKLVSGTNIKTINNETLLGSGDIALPSPADYVVEQGTSGIWTYRKWNSGIAECWGTTASTSHAMTQSSNNGWYVSEEYSLPSGLFIAVTSAQANRTGGGGLVFITINQAYANKLGYFVCTVSGSLTSTFSILFSVKGRWK